MASQNQSLGHTLSLLNVLYCRSTKIYPRKRSITFFDFSLDSILASKVYKKDYVSFFFGSINIRKKFANFSNWNLSPSIESNSFRLDNVLYWLMPDGLLFRYSKVQKKQVYMLSCKKFGTLFMVFSKFKYRSNQSSGIFSLSR